MHESPVQIKLVIALPAHAQGKRKRKRPSQLQGQWHSPFIVTAHFPTDPNATQEHASSPISSAGQGLTPSCSSLLSTYQNCCCSDQLHSTLCCLARMPGHEPPGLALGSTWPHHRGPTESICRGGDGHAPGSGTHGSLPQRWMGHAAGCCGSLAARRAGGMLPLQRGKVGRGCGN